jgi:hypothetical protein
VSTCLWLLLLPQSQSLRAPPALLGILIKTLSTTRGDFWEQTSQQLTRKSAGRGERNARWHVTQRFTSLKGFCLHSDSVCVVECAEHVMERLKNSQRNIKMFVEVISQKEFLNSGSQEEGQKFLPRAFLVVCKKIPFSSFNCSHVAQYDSLSRLLGSEQHSFRPLHAPFVFEFLLHCTC